MYENENQMSIDNGIADADTLLNENSYSVAEEAESLMSLIWISFTFFLSGNSVKLSKLRDVSIPRAQEDYKELPSSFKNYYSEVGLYQS